jgi:hypothetical protein
VRGPLGRVSTEAFAAHTARHRIDGSNMTHPTGGIGAYFRTAEWNHFRLGLDLEAARSFYGRIDADANAPPSDSARALATLTLALGSATSESLWARMRDGARDGADLR